MISHGFISGAMFLCIGVLYDRMHSRNIADYGGVVNTMPRFAALFMLFSMANSGLPATSGFVGEFMVILGAVQYNFWIGFLAATTLILGAAYSLWMYKRVIFGAVANEHVAALKDVDRREFWMLMAMAALVLFMGLYPKPFTDVTDASVERLLEHVSQYQDQVAERHVPSRKPARTSNLLAMLPEIALLLVACFVLLADATAAADEGSPRIDRSRCRADRCRWRRSSTWRGDGHSLLLRRHVCVSDLMAHMLKVCAIIATGVTS